MRIHIWRNTPIWRLVMLLALLAGALAALWMNRGDVPFLFSSRAIPMESASPNRLAIGATAATRGPVSPAIAEPMEFDGLTRQRILELRSEAVFRHASLVAGIYQPASVVFGQVQDGRPWWGLAGRFYFGPGDKSIAGPSVQSVNVLNPFLLVGADLWHDGDIRWDCAKVTDESVLDPNFPYLPRISALTIWPAEARGEAVYELSHFLKARAFLFDPATPWTETRIDLDAYNARDLGFAFLHVSLVESKNIVHEGDWTPMPIPQFLHTGGSCGYPGGCNNLSPRFPAAAGLKVTNLPATITVHLWRSKPGSEASPPDMLFLVKLI